MLHTSKQGLDMPIQQSQANLNPSRCIATVRCPIAVIVKWWPARMTQIVIERWRWERSIAQRSNKLEGCATSVRWIEKIILRQAHPNSKLISKMGFDRCTTSMNDIALSKKHGLTRVNTTCRTLKSAETPFMVDLNSLVVSWCHNRCAYIKLQERRQAFITRNRSAHITD